MKVKLTDIIMKDNYRTETSESDVAGLMASIKENGLLQPIVVTKRGNKFEIVAGHRRFNAVKKLGIKVIETNVVKVRDHVHKTTLNVVENLQREDATTYEIGRALYEMREKGEMSDSEIGIKIGIPASVVSRNIRLFKETPRKFRHLVKNVRRGTKSKDGLISNTIANDILQLEKSALINRAQVNDLFKKASKDDTMTQGKVKILARSLTDGLTFEEAKESLNQDISISSRFFMNKKDKARLEKKYRKPVRRLMTDAFIKQYRVNIGIK